MQHVSSVVNSSEVEVVVQQSSQDAEKRLEVLTDTQGRRINYLRLSVTDRCNLRCQYCIPPQGVRCAPNEAILSYEDLERIAQQSIALGLTKIRITGGEPLVRGGLVSFLERLAAMPGLDALVLTTNGMLLSALAKDLRNAGVQRLNVSLDSLRPDVFARITRGGELQRVLDGIEAAEQAGFPAPKLNMVVMRGVNDDEVIDFAELTMRKQYSVRFIEYMPTAFNPAWQQMWVSGKEILARIEQRYRLQPLPIAQGNGPARYFRIERAAGILGVITPISNHFCGQCNRIRITASGVAKGCLFDRSGIDLKPYLRAGDEALCEVLRQIAITKPARHNLLAPQLQYEPFSMSSIGG